LENEIYDTLYYYSEDGEEGYDLTEVQLIGKTDENRVEKLKLLLHHKNAYISYQAMLVLLAWAIPKDLYSLTVSFLKNGMKSTALNLTEFIMKIMYMMLS
jgi:hypothetical protein